MYTALFLDSSIKYFIYGAIRIVYFQDIFKINNLLYSAK